MANTQESVTTTSGDKTYEKQLKRVKEEHPQIKYEIEMDDKKTRCFLRSIDRATLETALGLTMKTSGHSEYIRAGEVILTSCWVTGDEIIKTNEDFLMSASMQAFQLIQIKSATLKKI